MVRRSVADIERLRSERDHSEEFDCRGHLIGRLWLDQGIALELHPSSRSANGDGALVRLFLGFHFVTENEVVAMTAHEHASLQPVFGLLWRYVDRAFATPDAGFELHVDGNVRIVAGSVQEQDYWEFHQPWRPRVDATTQ